MDTVLDAISVEISTIEKELPIVLYNLLLGKEVKTSTRQLLIYNDALDKCILKLDETGNINKIKRKELILQAQEIQKAIELSYKTSQTNIVEIQINNLYEINDTIKNKTVEIDLLKKQVTSLTMENHSLKKQIVDITFENDGLKRSMKIIHAQSNDFV